MGLDIVWSDSGLGCVLSSYLNIALMYTGLHIGYLMYTGLHIGYLMYTVGLHIGYLTCAVMLGISHT